MLPQIVAKLLITGGIAASSVSTSQAAILIGSIGTVGLSGTESKLDEHSLRSPLSSAVTRVFQVQQITDGRSDREANSKLVVAKAREILAILEEYKQRPAAARLPWARRMAPEPVQRDELYWLPDGSLHPIFEGIHPYIFIGELHRLAYTGRLSKDEYIGIRQMVAALPTKLFRVPYMPLD